MVEHGEGEPVTSHDPWHLDFTDDQSQDAAEFDAAW